MSNYLHAPKTGSTIFFTINLAQRGSDLLVQEIDLLRAAFRQTLQERPWSFDAIVVLPDRLHTVVSLPEGDANYATRWRIIKARFSQQMPKARVNARQVMCRERGIWQRRYWEHHIRNRADYWAHVSYCWAAPVRAGLVTQAAEWPYSSFQRDVQAGRVRADWS